MLQLQRHAGLSIILCLLLVPVLAVGVTGCGGKKGGVEDPGMVPDNGGTKSPGEGIGEDPKTRGKVREGMGEEELVKIYFDFDRSNVRVDQIPRAERNAEYLLSHPDLKVIIEGHCDERGTLEYNFALGQRRAKSVANFLINRGVAADRLRTVSKGEEEPAVLGSTEEAYAKNRRAEFEILN